MAQKEIIGGLNDDFNLAQPNIFLTQLRYLFNINDNLHYY